MMEVEQGKEELLVGLENSETEKEDSEKVKGSEEDLCFSMDSLEEGGRRGRLGVGGGGRESQRGERGGIKEEEEKEGWEGRRGLNGVLVSPLAIDDPRRRREL